MLAAWPFAVAVGLAWRLAARRPPAGAVFVMPVNILM
jgi:hypothetical protein